MSRAVPDLLVDTSIAIALVVADHNFHHEVVDALRGLTLGFSGHAAFETYSVLTRMPPPNRRSPATIAELIAYNFPASRFLGAAAEQRTLRDLARHGIAGGSVYDALVAAAAKEHGVMLATRDARALDTYRSVGVELRLL